MANLFMKGFVTCTPTILGSTQCTSDEDGNKTSEYSFDAWGRQRDPANWNNPASGLFGDRGFTGHEHLPEFGLINMNGRMYDPAQGRFLSPDPYIQSPGDLQSYNHYAYAFNNPLIYTDPSGYFSLGDIWDDAKKAARNITISSALTLATFVLLPGSATFKIVVSKAAFLMGGPGIGSYLDAKNAGASNEEALKAGAKTAAIAGASAAVFYGIGQAAQGIDNLAAEVWTGNPTTRFFGNNLQIDAKNGLSWLGGDIFNGMGGDQLAANLVSNAIAVRSSNRVLGANSGRPGGGGFNENYLEFTGTRSEGRRRTDGVLTWYRNGATGREILGSWDAVSGSRSLMPAPQGSYTVSNFRARSKAGFVKDGVGFSLDITPNPRFGRRHLRIHPDGGLPGTAGCIGLTGGACELNEFSTLMQTFLGTSGSMRLEINYKLPIMQLYP
ncbi:MAG: hypothetical protein HC896_13355 [Bacteroidales bacterium]|nr:hypothetical protein [Bacteroidales bacterium]